MNKTEKEIKKVWTKNKKDASEIAFHLDEIKISLSSMQDNLKVLSEEGLIGFLVEADVHFRWHLDNIAKVLYKKIYSHSKNCKEDKKKHERNFSRNRINKSTLDE